VGCSDHPSKGEWVVNSLDGVVASIYNFILFFF
jgi:hypothetical protein